ncbi:c-type cytochrome [Thermomonas sp. HDW16]|uniref:c-type cytochrome n=1 Tax=Thermomonas sp. HDW16 TaxID=2714945 RepID=UPI001408606A|nr:c-type cytochrome [Thermomonas sp. HDW16]QIL19680.1 cytochrome c4 [Thermomonas sp. HDW16]
MRLVRHGLVGVACLALATVAYAQSTAVAVPDNAPVQAAPLDDKPATWGDATAGQSKAGACAACHGLDGNAMQSNAPRIAGMPERYIAQQLALFKNGERTSGLAPVMVPFASMLSAQDMRDVGAWFASQKAGAGIADDTVIADGPNKGLKFYQVGEKLFRAGDTARGIPACMACHGPSGAGNPGPAYPALHGQDSTYAVRRLEEYRTGTTTAKDADAAHFNLMASVAKTLTDEEIQSLGSYVQGLHARSAGTSQTASGH